MGTRWREDLVGWREYARQRLLKKVVWRELVERNGAIEVSAVLTKLGL